jgi:hypothetical protein
MMREDTRAELRIVSRADYMCRCATHELHLLFIWLFVAAAPCVWMDRGVVVGRVVGGESAQAGVAERVEVA